MKLLIAGIDPGTTVGYAFLDLDGKPVLVGSSKELSLDDVVEKARKIGKPIIIGCDKGKTPSFVEKFCAKFNAKLVGPSEDMLVIEKKRTVASHKTKNNHEMDALASALFAFKKSKSLFSRVDKYLAAKNRPELASKIKEIVLKHEISIYSAFEMLDTPEKEESRIIKKVVGEKKISEKDFTRLFDSLQESKKTESLLKQRIQRLKEKLSQSKKPIIKKQVLPDERLKFKDQKIHLLTNKLKEKTAEAASLLKIVDSLRQKLSKVKTKIVLKRLKNLGWNELQSKKHLLHLEKGDIILVEDPNEFSEKTLDYLNGLVDIIVHKKDVGRKAESSLNCILINGQNLDIDETELFGFVNKGQFEEARRNKDLLKKIVKEYQSGRQRT